MKSILIENSGSKIQSSLIETEPRPLNEAEVRIQSKYSGINYKDALGVTGTAPIFKTLPLVPGIDVSGKVTESKNKNFVAGDKVLITGCGLGETHDGGYSEFVIGSEKTLIHIPKNLTSKEAMIYGTAGFTAALAIERMLSNGQKIEMGPIVVTGASGGVGQFATYFFSKLGFEVIAVSGKKNSHLRLLEIGASKISSPSEIQRSSRPLDRAHFGGIVDNVGGELLTDLIPHVQLWGNIACIGLAGGSQLNTTVMPLILRGVSLLGASSNNCQWELRKKIWKRLATELKPNEIESFVAEEISLNQVIEKSYELLNRKIMGRLLIKF